METYYILQGLIYAFNEDRVRDMVMKRASSSSSKTKFVWKGTLRLDASLSSREQLTALQRWRRRGDKIFLFTASYVYRRNRIHYVAFAFDPRRRSLVCFDPGYDLYLYGRHKIIPLVANALYEAGRIDAPTILKGPCLRRQGFGIQYDGRNAKKVVLPADAFCQMWTLFFLTTYVQENGSLSFFEDWCRVRPRFREYFLLQHFTIPMLRQHPSVLVHEGGNVSDRLERYLTMAFWTQVR